MLLSLVIFEEFFRLVPKKFFILFILLKFLYDFFLWLLKLIIKVIFNNMLPFIVRSLMKRLEQELLKFEKPKETKYLIITENDLKGKIEDNVALKKKSNNFLSVFD